MIPAKLLHGRDSTLLTGILQLEIEFNEQQIQCVHHCSPFTWELKKIDAACIRHTVRSHCRYSTNTMFTHPGRSRYLLHHHVA